MKTSIRNHSLLAAVGAAALAIYVLACTSFSPDDSKVVFPSFDLKSGDMGVSVYDRKSGFTEPIFVAARIHPPDQKEQDVASVRPQWSADGKSILVAWAMDSDDKRLNLAILPFARRGPTRMFVIPDVAHCGQKLVNPLAVAGNRLFFVPETDQIARLDLETGDVRTNQLEGREVTLLPSPNGDQILYVTGSQGLNHSSEVGWINPETFARSPLPQIKPQDMQGEGALAISSDAKRVAIVTTSSNKLDLCVSATDGTEKRQSLDWPFKQARLGSGSFAPGQNMIYAAYANDDDTNSVMGLAEIPLNGGTVRCTPLLARVDGIEKEDLMYFQLGLSHDGKTAAFCSTYMAFADQPTLRPEDCALIFVDLTSPDRKVKRVPLPFPKKPVADGKK